MSIFLSTPSLETVVQVSNIILAALCVIPLVRLFTAKTEARRHGGLTFLVLGMFTNLIFGAYANWVLADSKAAIANSISSLGGATGGHGASAWQGFLTNMSSTLVILFVLALLGYYANRHATHRIHARNISV